MDKTKYKENPNIEYQYIITDNGNIEASYMSPYEYVGNKSPDEIFSFYNYINFDIDHMNSNDDVCTPMECVKTMIDYIPKSFWNNKKIKILDPCSGNGNFGAYCISKTSASNIWYNELNRIRFENCKKILNPKHINNQDFFNLSGDWNTSWDLIMANPPYSGGGNKNRSLSNIFIEHSINLLNNGGYLCFVTPNNWMTYNTNNTTLKRLLNEGSFLVIDNDVKKYFPGVGSSFTIFVWQKGVFDNTTKIINNYLLKDIQENVVIPRDLPFIPLYVSQTVISLITKVVSKKRNKFDYRCDLHNFTQKKYLSDIKNDIFKYETIHTLRKTRYSSKKQDIFDKWIIVVPLSTYYLPIIKHNVNVTQSVGYIAFENKKEAENYLEIITQPHFKLLVHLTRYGNFNNIMVLRFLAFEKKFKFSKKELNEINKLVSLIKY